MAKEKGENMEQEKNKQELEEIAALTFHKHGRKPFELKKGDLLYNKNSENSFTYDGLAPNMTNHKLKTGEYIFVKTREEVKSDLDF